MAINRKTRKVAGEMHAMSFYLYRMIRSSPSSGMFVSIIPNHTFISGNKYSMVAVKYPLDKMLADEAKMNNKATLFWIAIEPQTEKPSVLSNSDLQIGENLDIYGKLLKKLKEESPRSYHELCILRLDDKFCIIQSYFGYYNMKQCLDFNEPLCRGENLPKINNIFKIDKNPQYRGIFPIKDMKKLAKVFGTLMIEGNHQNNYANITGIIFPETLLSSRFIFKTMRLDLDLILHE